MGLSTYNKKRNFKKTAEPTGKASNKENTHLFVVQKHHASHLHYDFRLEMDGVLKSWAVPKGPSMNPDDKRLAMMVEDHPYNYKDFEGNIPEGNYGAGNVIVWDNGTYTPANKEDDEKALRHGLHKGHIDIILKGKKLKGEFSLIKIKNGKQENAWLLIKKDDKYATEADITLKEKSVLSSLTLKKLADKYDNEKTGELKGTRKKSAAKKATSKKAAVKKKSVKKKPLQQVKPMLAKLSDKVFDDPDWLYEIKFDGYRALAQCNGDGYVDLYSRNQNSFNEDYTDIVDSLKAINHQCLLDGEVVIEEKGVSKFQLLQNYTTTHKGTLLYYVFDMLQLDGNDLTDMPLVERKEILQLLLKQTKLKGVIYSEHTRGDGTKLLAKAKKRGYEGIIAKRAESIYHTGQRSPDWQKIKLIKNEEAVICGITAPQGARKNFGSLLLGMYNNGKLHFIGGCGTGFNDDDLKKLYAQFKPLFTNQSPFEEKVKMRTKIQWLKPKLVCQVKFSEWTAEGHLRHPVFLGLRKDKKPGEVVIENTTAMKTNKPSIKILAQEKDYELKVGKVTLQLTNQQKLYWPQEKITKGDLVNYYSEVADLMLPYLKDRPESMHRFPGGIKDEGFYQKDVDTDKIPSWLKTKQVYSESNNKNIDYLICNDKATLLYMANLGCIEINPWSSRIQKPEHPDWMVIDLDPQGIAFKEVVTTALEVRKFLEALEIDSYCKTSGATGLHIYVPLKAKYDYDTVKTFAQLVATEVNSQLPSTTSILRMPNKRKRKVYIDFLQNRRGQTLAAPYSVRPREGATVSTPLEWKEVNGRLNPAKFTIKNTLKRIDAKDDLWKKVLGKGADLHRAMKIYNENYLT